MTRGNDTEPTGGGEDPDLGEPIAELRDVGFPVGDQFVTRVRGRIERRVLGGEILELAWTAPMTMLLEFLRWPFEVLAERRK